MESLQISGPLSGKSPSLREASITAPIQLHLLLPLSLPLGTLIESQSSDDPRASVQKYKILDVSAGYRHISLIAHCTSTNTIKLFTCGTEEAGRLGVDMDLYREYGSDTLTLYEVPIPSSPSTSTPARNIITQASCGREHTLILSSLGNCYSFGWGEAGRLGLGYDDGAVSRPALITSYVNQRPPTNPLLSDDSPALLPNVTIKYIAAGREHSLFVSSPHGYVYSCGASFGGRLGLTFSKKTRVRKDGTTTVQDDNDADVMIPQLAGITKHIKGDSRAPPDPSTTDAPPLLQQITKVAAGDLHSVALSSSGLVYTWGFPDSGALGRPETPSDSSSTPAVVDFIASDQSGPTSPPPVISSIAAGAYHTICSSTTGACYTFGDGADGQLGHGEPYGTVTVPKQVAQIQNVRSVDAGFCTSSAVTTSGQGYVWGCPEGQDGAPIAPHQGLPKPVKSAGDINRISLGGYCAVAVSKDQAGDKIREERRRGKQNIAPVNVTAKRWTNLNSKLLYSSVASRAVAGAGLRGGTVGSAAVGNIKWGGEKD
jgi:alpha-tubulin suppressor-like RCC1 family protein